MNSKKSEMNSSAQQFEHKYKEAYYLIDRGITLVTEGKKNEAASLFEQGLKLVDEALSIKVESLDVSAEQTQIYAEMQIKMRCTRKEVMNHFSDCQTSQTGESISTTGATADDPPSYQDYLNSLNSEGQASEKSDVYPNLNGLQADTGALTSDAASLQSPKSGEMIFFIESGVQIFFIYANGRVTSPSYPSFLAIFTLSEPICGDGHNGGLGARGILQVGNWSYPLVPAQSPVLHSFYGSYMFPDPSNSEPGTSVGIIIPDSCDKDSREMFEQILIQMTSFHEQKVPQGVNAVEERAQMEKSAVKRISEGAQYVSVGVNWGAEKIGHLISFSSDKLKESLKPDDAPRSIDPKWQKTAKVARDVSGTAVKISSFLVHHVGKATVALGKAVAPSIKKHGTKAFGHFTGQGEKQAGSQVDGIMEVASGAVIGASTVYLSLEKAAYDLTASLAKNTVGVVSHKYGNEAGQLTDNTLYAVGQTASAGYNFSSLGVKGIAKRTAKETGKAIIHKDKTQKTSPTDNSPDEWMDVTHDEIRPLDLKKA